MCCLLFGPVPTTTILRCVCVCVCMEDLYKDSFVRIILYYSRRSNHHHHNYCSPSFVIVLHRRRRACVCRRLSPSWLYKGICWRETRHSRARGVVVLRTKQAATHEKPVCTQVTCKGDMVTCKGDMWRVKDVSNDAGSVSINDDWWFTTSRCVRHMLRSAIVPHSGTMGGSRVLPFDPRLH